MQPSRSARATRDLPEPSHNDARAVEGECAKDEGQPTRDGCHHCLHRVPLLNGPGRPCTITTTARPNGVSSPGASPSHRGISARSERGTSKEEGAGAWAAGKAPCAGAAEETASVGKAAGVEDSGPAAAAAATTTAAAAESSSVGEGEKVGGAIVLIAGAARASNGL